MTSDNHGRRCTHRLHLYGSVSVIGLTRRVGNGRFNDGMKLPASSTKPPTGAAISNAFCFSPTPTSASATRPAAMTPRQRVTSTRSPTKPSSAGSSVTEAIIVKSTVIDAPTAMPFMKLTPMINMPRSEITTVVPANNTARPAVSTASAVAAAQSPPR